MTAASISGAPGETSKRGRWRPLLPWIGAGLVLIAALGLALAWYITMPDPRFRQDDPALTPGDAAHGREIFTAGLCASCHATPGQDDRLKLGGGLALASPFGTFRVPNISSDRQDGIGAWSVADLANALISGVSPAGQHYYPAFPYVTYTAMNLDDVRDLYAFLQTLEPVAGRAPPHEIPLIFRIRRSLGFWKLLFFKQGQSEAILNGDPLHDRGAYLAEVLSHCADCHSTRNILGGIEPKTRFAGGKDPEGIGYVPNITAARLKDWSKADVAEMLKSGRTPDHGRVGSSMADVVNNTSQLPQADRDAIAAYIKAIPARETPAP